jgi:hypothetical protein
MAERLPPAVEAFFAAARELEPDPVRVRSAIGRAVRVRRRRRPSRRVAAAIAVALLAAGSALAAGGKLGIVEGFDSPGTWHSDGNFVYLSPVYAVADVHVPHFGRVRLTHRRSSIGDCNGVQLLDEWPRGARPGMAEGCGDSSTFQAGLTTTADGRWALVHGRVPDTTRAVRITARGREIARAQLVRNAGQIPYVAFVAAIPRAGLCDVRAVADDPTLPATGGIDVGYRPCRKQREHVERWRRPG